MFGFFCASRLRKSAGTKVERLSLTQAEANEAANGRRCGRRFQHQGAVFPEITSLFAGNHSRFFMFLFSPLGAATPGMMGKSIWSEHVSGSGKQIRENFSSTLFNCLIKQSKLVYRNSPKRIPYGTSRTNQIPNCTRTLFGSRGYATLLG